MIRRRRGVTAAWVLKGDLEPAGEGLKMLAELRRSRGVQLVHLGVLELQVKPDPVVGVPTEIGAENLL